MNGLAREIADMCEKKNRFGLKGRYIYKLANMIFVYIFLGF